MFPAGAKEMKMIVEVNDEDVVTVIPGARRTEYSWGSISLYLHSARVHLLYTSPERFILIPNRVLTSADKSALRELIVRYGIKEKAC